MNHRRATSGRVWSNAWSARHVQGQDHGILDGSGVERLGLPEEGRNVTEDIPGTQFLQDHVSAADRSRELDPTGADDVHLGCRISLAEHVHPIGDPPLAQFLD